MSVDSSARLRLQPRPPLCTKGPTPAEKAGTEGLLSLLAEESPVCSSMDLVARELVIQSLQRALRDWVAELALSKGLYATLAAAADAGGDLYISGSYRLGVAGPGADVDAICVTPRFVTSADFFDGMTARLRRIPGIAKVRPIPNAGVPMTEVELDGIEVDLLFCRLDRPTVPPNGGLDILDDLVLKGTDVDSVRSLNGPRVTEMLVRLVPDYETFRVVLRACRLWCKRRGMYSNKLGFLGGVNLAILAAYFCQRYPARDAAGTLFRLFYFLATWKWPAPVFITKSYVRPDIPTGQKVWNPVRNASDARDLMPIITPAFPCASSTYNVLASTLDVMRKEFRRGMHVMTSVLAGPDPSDPSAWAPLFESDNFLFENDGYIVVHAWSTDGSVHGRFVGYIESRLRHLVRALEGASRHLSTIFPYPRSLEWEREDPARVARREAEAAVQAHGEHGDAELAAAAAEAAAAAVAATTGWQPGQPLIDAMGGGVPGLADIDEAADAADESAGAAAAEPPSDQPSKEAGWDADEPRDADADSALKQPREEGDDAAAPARDGPAAAGGEQPAAEDEGFADADPVVTPAPEPDAPAAAAGTDAPEAPAGTAAEGAATDEATEISTASAAAEAALASDDEAEAYHAATQAAMGDDDGATRGADEAFQQAIDEGRQPMKTFFVGLRFDRAQASRDGAVPARPTGPAALAALRVPPAALQHWADHVLKSFDAADAAETLGLAASVVPWEALPRRAFTELAGVPAAAAASSAAAPDLASSAPGLPDSATLLRRREAATAEMRREDELRMGMRSTSTWTEDAGAATAPVKAEGDAAAASLLGKDEVAASKEGAELAGEAAGGWGMDGASTSMTSPGVLTVRGRTSITTASLHELRVSHRTGGVGSLATKRRASLDEGALPGLEGDEPAEDSDAGAPTVAETAPTADAVRPAKRARGDSEVSEAADGVGDGASGAPGATSSAASERSGAPASGAAYQQPAFVRRAPAAAPGLRPAYMSAADKAIAAARQKAAAQAQPAGEPPAKRAKPAPAAKARKRKGGGRKGTVML
ncbi:hypothetical protein FNF27_02704 [Cafeteria roenbergensis]|uniref:polynucleotide adenylyltransferase n=2 Tax=Cafeteria roenbergensis TaxID=33653 RepID=A0A5A8EDP1_CAFRO|nr:hypothetical protein FNF27_02704 [Cafeteria roenbergensis]